MKLSIQEANGKLHEGVHVHGCNDRQSLEREIRRASTDKRLLACVEQKPGHARCIRQDGGSRCRRTVRGLRNAVDCLSVKGSLSRDVHR